MKQASQENNKNVTPLIDPKYDYTPEKREEEARTQMGKTLLVKLVEEVKNMQKPWQKLSESEQQAVIERFAMTVNTGVREAVYLLATHEHPTLRAKVDQVLFKDGIKAVLSCAKVQAAHDLADKEGLQIMVVMCDPDQFTQGMEQVEAEKDQAELPLGDDEIDPLYDEALGLVIEENNASISFVQRKLRIGYNRSARLIEDMEKAGVVSPLDSEGRREVLTPAATEEGAKDNGAGKQE